MIPVFLAKMIHKERNIPASKEEINPFALPTLLIFQGDRRKITPRKATLTANIFILDIFSFRRILPKKVVHIGCV